MVQTITWKKIKKEKNISGITVYKDHAVIKINKIDYNLYTDNFVNEFNKIKINNDYLKKIPLKFTLPSKKKKNLWFKTLTITAGIVSVATIGYFLLKKKNSLSLKKNQFQNFKI